MRLRSKTVVATLPPPPKTIGSTAEHGRLASRIAAMACLTMAFVASTALAAPLEPSRDDEVVETLPAAIGDRAEARRLRAALAARPGDVGLAVETARRHLARARALGDPRFAGLAEAALAPWPDAAKAPAEVALMRATLLQYRHDFDAAVTTLRELGARPGGERQAQVWLTLATVLRVQGRYDESDAACRRVVAAGVSVYGEGCLAENAGLRGPAEPARAAFSRLLSTPGLALDTRTWLLISLAELEERDGRPTRAEEAFRDIERAGADLYAAVAHADFLLGRGRPLDAVAALRGQPRSDGVVLRLAIAGARARTADAARDAADLRARIADANERPDARVVHGREQAMFALWVEGRAAEAVELARGNLSRQREPIDVLIFAAAAKAAGDAVAVAEAQRLRASLPLLDRRIDALR